MGKVKVGGVWVVSSPKGRLLRGKPAYKKALLEGKPHKVPRRPKRLGSTKPVPPLERSLARPRKNARVQLKFRSKSRPAFDE